MLNDCSPIGCNCNYQLTEYQKITISIITVIAIAVIAGLLSKSTVVGGCTFAGAGIIAFFIYEIFISAKEPEINMPVRTAISGGSPPDPDAPMKATAADASYPNVALAMPTMATAAPAVSPTPDAAMKTVAVAAVSATAVLAAAPAVSPASDVPPLVTAVAIPSASVTLAMPMMAAAAPSATPAAPAAPTAAIAPPNIQKPIPYDELRKQNEHPVMLKGLDYLVEKADPGSFLCTNSFGSDCWCLVKDFSGVITGYKAIGDLFHEPVMYDRRLEKGNSHLKEQFALPDDILFYYDDLTVKYCHPKSTRLKDQTGTAVPAI